MGSAVSSAQKPTGSRSRTIATGRRVAWRSAAGSVTAATPE
jgi:hypothetical protein